MWIVVGEGDGFDGLAQPWLVADKRGGAQAGIFDGGFLIWEIDAAFK